MLSSSTTRHRANPVRRRLIIAGFLLGGLLAGGFVAAAPAAAVPGLERAHAHTEHNSVATKESYAECAPGDMAIGGYARIVGSDQVRITAAYPDPFFGYRFIVAASEPEGGTSESWRIEIDAICAPESSLPGLEYVEEQSTLSSNTWHQASATCDPGQRMLGMGGYAWVNGFSSSQAALTGVRPANATPTQVTVTGYEDLTGYSGNWQVGAIAVCVDPVPGLVPVPQVSAYSQDHSRLVEPQCPTGTEVHSVGFQIDANGYDGAVHLDELFGNTTKGHLEAFESDAAAGSWRLRGYAICAD